MRKTIASLQAEIESLQKVARNEPVAYRILMAFVSRTFTSDVADRSVRVEVGGDDVALVAYGFLRRDGYDVLILQVGMGAGEGIINIEWRDADDYIDEVARIEPAVFTDYITARRSLAETFRRWLADPSELRCYGVQPESDCDATLPTKLNESIGGDAR